MGSKKITNENTLIKYENPVVVATYGKKSNQQNQAMQALLGRPTTPAAGEIPDTTTKEKPVKMKAAICEESGISKKEMEDILNAIIPPREWEEDGKLWRQTVSLVPASRVDVITLQEQLDTRLKQRQARETGICPIRRELFAQCFDELIRQVTINCAERGLLLVRVRDEAQMTMAAYQSLYESATAYAMRKALFCEAGKAEVENKISDLIIEKEHLETDIADLEVKIEQEERRYGEVQEGEEKRRIEEVQNLKRANIQLKQQLEAIIAPRKGGGA